MDLLIETETLKYLFLFIISFYNFKIIGNIFQFNITEKTLVNLLSKIMSLIHSIYIVSSCMNFNENKISENTFINSLNVTKAYLLYDIFVMTYYRNYVMEYKKLMLHHIILFLGLYSNKVHEIPLFVSKGLMAEITNVPLTIGWILIKRKKEKSMVFILNGFILLTLFFIYRVINFTNLFLLSLNITDKMYEMSFVGIIMLVNIYWFTKLLQKFFTSLFQIC